MHRSIDRIDFVEHMGCGEVCKIILQGHFRPCRLLYKQVHSKRKTRKKEWVSPDQAPKSHVVSKRRWQTTD